MCEWACLCVSDILCVSRQHDGKRSTLCLQSPNTVATEHATTAHITGFSVCPTHSILPAYLCWELWQRGPDRRVEIFSFSLARCKYNTAPKWIHITNIFLNKYNKMRSYHAHISRATHAHARVQFLYICLAKRQHVCRTSTKSNGNRSTSLATSKP